MSSQSHLLEVYLAGVPNTRKATHGEKIPVWSEADTAKSPGRVTNKMLEMVVDVS